MKETCTYALATRILACIQALATSRAITDTIWLGDRGITVCEELAAVAAELGADDEEIEAILSGQRKEGQ